MVSLRFKQGAPVICHCCESAKAGKLKDGEGSSPRIKAQVAAQVINPFETHFANSSQRVVVDGRHQQDGRFARSGCPCKLLASESCLKVLEKR